MTSAGERALTLTGTSLLGEGTPTEAPIALTLAADGNETSCQTTLGLVDESPGARREANPPFDAKALGGIWTTPCGAGALGRFGSTHFSETLAFGAAGALTHTLTIYDDQECAAGHDVANVALAGTFGAKPAGGTDNDVALDYSYTSFTVTTKSADLATAFSAASICGHRPWIAGASIRFDAGECAFDLGDGAQMNLSSLGRKAEFTAARRLSASVMDVARTSHFVGDQKSARAIVGGGEARRFKRSL